MIQKKTKRGDSNELKSKLNVARFEATRISLVLGAHVGPGIVGAAVVPMELMEDLVK
jgi:fatty acid-binding protein DegV